MNPLCIYHANCADGFAAAWVFKNYATREFDFYPGVYQDPPPDVTGRDVYLVDFSYKRPVIEEMLKTASSITLIDHHESAIENLAPLIDSGRIHSLTSVEYSGAMLAWRWFHGNSEPPKLLHHIQDRDLWRFHLEGTREIQAAIFSYPYDFKVWDRLMTADTHQLFVEGSAIERKHHKDIAELISIFRHRAVIAGYDVPVANLPYTLSSDAGNIMAYGEPFAACYYNTPEGVVFSLRSAEDGKNVAEIAKLFGGGGHKHAAGFRIPHSQVEELFRYEA